MINKRVNSLIIEVAKLIALQEMVTPSHIAYKNFEKNISAFLSKYQLKETTYGERIIDNLLTGRPTEYLSNEECREILIGLVGIKNTLGKKYDKIFISHSSKDIKSVKEFVNILEFIGLNDEQIFCSSIPGYGIPLGENIYDYLKREFDDSDLFVIFFLSENYYTSPACLNEMGATWIDKNDYQAILINDFKFDNIDGAIDPRGICFELNDKYRLNEFKEKIETIFKLGKKNNSRWEQVRDEMIKRIKASL